MRKYLFYCLLFLFPLSSGAQNSGNVLYAGIGAGIGFHNTNAYLHASLGVTYLRFSKFGFSVSGFTFAGGVSSDSIGTVKNGNNFHVSICYALQNSMAYGIFKLGLSGSNGTYVSEYNPNSSSQQTSEYSTYGLYIAAEVISNSNPRWSIEVFGALNRYSQGGFTIRRNIGSIM